MTIPNIPLSDVPAGQDELENIEIFKWGIPPQIKNAKEHFEIAGVKPVWTLRLQQNFQDPDLFCYADPSLEFIALYLSSCSIHILMSMV